MEHEAKPDSEKQRIDAALKRFDEDLSLIEELPDPLDRGRHALDLFKEAIGRLDHPLYGKGYRGEVLNPTGWGDHYRLPDWDKGVRPYTDYAPESTWGAITPNHTFLPVEQHSMWRADLDNQPYLYASMSECSLLIGKNDYSLWVAHVGYSKTEWVEAAFKKMTSEGIAPDQMVVVASVGPYQESASDSGQGGFGHRATVADYQRLGIPPDQIIEFTYSWDGQNQTGINIAEVLVNPREVYVKTADYKMEVIQGFARDTQIGPDTAEHVKAL